MTAAHCILPSQLGKERWYNGKKSREIGTTFTYSTNEDTATIVTAGGAGGSDQIYTHGVDHSGHGRGEALYVVNNQTDNAVGDYVT